MAPLDAGAPLDGQGRRVTIAVTDDAHRWLCQVRVDRGVTAAALLRALIAEAEADPALLDRAIARAEADA